MDFVEDSDDDSKYAFLLGSALRNDDSEQLFIVYDNLIPSTVSQTRLEGIKEGARYVSELPEEEFNALVLNARTFSLASTRSNSTKKMEKHTMASSNRQMEEDEECEAVSIMQGDKATITHYGSMNLQKHSTPKAVDEGLNLNLDYLGDQDSGFRGSSSFMKNSISCSDSNDDSEDDRPGCFDYVPLITHKSPNRDHVRIRQTLNPEYDEDIKVEGSTGGSSVDSPRSETSLTVEDYNLADDVEMQVFSHGSHDFQNRGDGSQASFSAVNEHQHLYGGSKRNQNERFYEFGTWQSKRDDALRYSYNGCQDSSMGNSASTYGSQQQNKSLSSKHGKGFSKDDNDKLTAPVGLDVNGNPQSVVNISNYEQMRQSPSTGKVVDCSQISAPLTNHSSSSQTPLSSEPQSDLERKRLRKLKKQAKQQFELSQAVKDFKGDQPIDTLLSFIEGAETNNHKKKGASNSNQSQLLQQNNQNNNPSQIVGSTKSEKQKKKQEKNKIAAHHNDKSTDEPRLKHSHQTVSGNSSSKDGQESNTSTPSYETGSISTSYEKDKTSGEINSITEQNSITVTVNRSPVAVESDSKKSSIKVVKTKANSTVSKTNAGKHESSVVNAKKTDSVENKRLLSNSLLAYEQKSVEHSNPATSFIEVKKKKKRNTPKDMPATSIGANMQHEHSYYPRDNNMPVNFNKWRHPPGPNVANNFPSHSSIYSPHNNTDFNNGAPVAVRPSKEELPLDLSSTSTTDLSPSSFPTLMGHNAPPNDVPRTERRNSCGDLTEIKTDVNQETKSFCDSDKESVKSLPASHHNSGAAGDSSSLYTVSYASMAAALRPHGECSNSPSSESGIVCGSHDSSISSGNPHSSLELVSPSSEDKSDCDGSSTPDRKTTVWKGSPRERRHSIGSSPDDKPDSDSSTVNPRNRQKSGSQECLAMILTSNVPTSESTNSSVPSNSSVSFSENCVGVKFIGESHVMTMNPSFNGVEFGSNSDPFPKLTSTKLTHPSKSSPVSFTTNSLLLAATKPNTSVSKQKTSVKSLANKSVVFLDKRFSSKSPNLGITFGFDSSIPSPKPLVDNNQTCSSVPPSDLLVSSSISHTVSSQPSDSSNNVSSDSYIPDANNLTSVNKKAVNKTEKELPKSNNNSIPTTLNDNRHAKQRITSFSANHDRTVPKNIDNNKFSNHSFVNHPTPPLNIPHRHSYNKDNQKHFKNPNIMHSAHPMLAAQMPHLPIPPTGPIILPTAFIGSSMVPPYSRFYPPPPIHQRQMVPMPHPQHPAVGPMLPSPYPNIPANDHHHPSIISNQKSDASSSVKTSSPLPQPFDESTVTSQASTEAHTCSDGSIKVVYGLGIKPGGCGAVFFRPVPGEVSSKKQKKGAMSDMSSFLRKKWSKVKELESKGEQRYVTITD